MGYWDSHPMAGDLPMDAEYDLDGLLFTTEEIKKELQYDQIEFERRFRLKLEEASEVKFYQKQNYVLPFKMVEYEIRTNDSVLSQKIKDMIGDGGAVCRNYPIDVESNKENGYNNFESPYDYARHLYDIWDDLMSGKIDFDQTARCKGLFEKISEGNNKNGFTNMN